MVSPTMLSQLIHTLRIANARYTHIALIHRSTLRRTYHAKRRAYCAGLHIDTLKARDCPNKYVSRQPLPVIDSNPVIELELERPASLVPSMCSSTISTLAPALGLELANIPDIIVSSPISNYNNTSLVDQTQRLTIRMPPLHLNYSYPDIMHMGADGSVPPGAPRLKPMQLPDEDDAVLLDGHGFDQQHPLSSGSSLGELMTPNDDIDLYSYTGLRIMIPSRYLKRKVHDIESEDGDDGGAAYPRLKKQRIGVVQSRQWTRLTAHSHRRDSMTTPSPYPFGRG
ncbi:hypothetical protein J3A83DRAFT_4535118 [Scleroderma citrinum]